MLAVPHHEQMSQRHFELFAHYGENLATLFPGLWATVGPGGRCVPAWGITSGRGLLRSVRPGAKWGPQRALVWLRQIEHLPNTKMLAWVITDTLRPFVRFV